MKNLINILYVHGYNGSGSGETAYTIKKPARADFRIGVLRSKKKLINTFAKATHGFKPARARLLDGNDYNCYYKSSNHVIQANQSSDNLNNSYVK